MGYPQTYFHIISDYYLIILTTICFTNFVGTPTHMSFHLPSFPTRTIGIIQTKLRLCLGIDDKCRCTVSSCVHIAYNVKINFESNKSAKESEKSSHDFTIILNSKMQLPFKHPTFSLPIWGFLPSDWCPVAGPWTWIDLGVWAVSDLTPSACGMSTNRIRQEAGRYDLRGGERKPDSPEWWHPFEQQPSIPAQKKWWDGETEQSSGAPPRPYTGPYKM